MKTAILLAALCAVASAQVTTYELELSGSSNSPTTNTGASASLVISFVDATPTSPTGAVVYNLTFENVIAPLAAHIHVGAGPGGNGSVAVPLWMGNFAPNPSAPPVSGLVASNEIVPPTFAGPLEMLPLYNNTPVAMLLSEYIETGLAYAQVHTMANPYGEIRANFDQEAIVEGVSVNTVNSTVVPTA